MKNKAALIRRISMLDDPDEVRKTLAGCSPVDVREVARGVLRERIREAVELLRACEPCHTLLSGGGYDPVEMLTRFLERVGRRGAQMDIDPRGCGGLQHGQGYETWIRFGPAEFLTGTSLAGMTVRESQLQVILHELAHAAGDVIPPDGGDAGESLRNQRRITRVCLPAAYQRIVDERESHANV